MLRMIQIDKSFNIGTINEKQIFQGLNLTINDGDFLTVIGGNGAGKSTMLNLIAGVHKADGGRIILDGEDLTYKNETQRARYIGRVFQDPMMGTAPTMMIEENLAMAYRRGVNLNCTALWNRTTVYSIFPSLIKKKPSMTAIGKLITRKYWN